LKQPIGSRVCPGTFKAAQAGEHLIPPATATFQICFQCRIGYIVRIKTLAFIRHCKNEFVLATPKTYLDEFVFIKLVAVYNGIVDSFCQAGQNISIKRLIEIVLLKNLINIGLNNTYVGSI